MLENIEGITKQLVENFSKYSNVTFSKFLKDFEETFEKSCETFSTKIKEISDKFSRNFDNIQNLLCSSTKIKSTASILPSILKVSTTNSRLKYY